MNTPRPNPVCHDALGSPCEACGAPLVPFQSVALPTCDLGRNGPRYCLDCYAAAPRKVAELERRVAALEAMLAPKVEPVHDPSVLREWYTDLKAALDREITEALLGLDSPVRVRVDPRDVRPDSAPPPRQAQTAVGADVAYGGADSTVAAATPPPPREYVFEPNGERPQIRGKLHTEKIEVRHGLIQTELVCYDAEGNVVRLPAPADEVRPDHVAEGPGL
jgi:hypothetical protein